MTGQRAIAVVLLVASLFVLGTMSASLDATVTSTPNDAIDVDTDSMPFMGDGVSDIADSYERSPQGAAEAEVQAENSDSPEGGGGNPLDGRASNAGASDNRGEGQSQPAASRSDGAASAGGGGQQGGGSGAGSDDSRAGQGGTGGSEQSLWALLEQLLVVLLALFALLILLVAGLFLARRRHRVLARLRTLAARYGLLPGSSEPTFATVTDGVGEAGSVVERAWGQMVRESDVDPPPGDTPRECTRAAIDAGLKREPAEKLTGLYERVRYGERPVTPEHASRALRWAREATAGEGTELASDLGQAVGNRSTPDGPDTPATRREGAS